MAVVVPVTKMAAAKKMVKALAKNIGDATRSLMELRSLQASETLVQQIEGSLTSMQQIYAGKTLPATG